MVARTVSNVYFDFRSSLARNRIKGLWQMMTDYRLSYTGANLALAVSAVAKTATFLLLKSFADTLTGTVPPFAGGLDRTLMFMALGFVGLAAVEGGFSFVSGRLAAFAAEGITRRLRNFLFDHIQRLSFTYHGKTPTGDLIERCTSDVDALRRFFSEQAIGVGRIIAVFLANFTALLVLNVHLALASVVVMPFILVISVWFFRRVSKAYEAYQEQEAKLSTTLQENLTGVRVVKAFARQDYEIDKFEADNQEKFERGKRLLSMHSVFWPISDLVLGFQTLGGFVFAALLTIHGEITIGGYLAYVGLIGWLIWPIRNLGRLIVQTSTGMVSYDRVMEIVKQEREGLIEGKVQPVEPVKGEIEFRHVSFQYEPDLPVLKDVSFHCKAGQVVALLGSTGSGKSSLVNLLPRFYDYTEGSLQLDGVELTDYPREYLRRQIGIVEQEPFLFSRSIRENILYGVGKDVSQEELEQAAKVAAVHEVIQTFPEGYNTLVGEKGVTLSGGQKQRVAIARTLLKNPRILILDDSTSSVDTETEAEIRGALNLLMKERTTFLIAHRIQSVMHADLILVLDKGQVVQMGQHNDLVAQDGIYRQIFEIQTRIGVELDREIAGLVGDLAA